MKLTPFAKVFLVLVILGVGGFIGFKKYGDNLRSWSGAGKAGDPKPADADVNKSDFNFVGDKNVDAPRTGDVPVTAIFGDHDRILPAPNLQERSLLPGHARWVSLVDCGHAPQWDAPGAVVRELVRTTSAVD